MTRDQAIATITSSLPSLDDERLDALAGMIETWTKPTTVYDTLPAFEKAKIDAALDRLAAGQGVSADAVFASTDAKLKAAGV